MSLQNCHCQFAYHLCLLKPQLIQWRSRHLLSLQPSLFVPVCYKNDEKLEYACGDRSTIELADAVTAATECPGQPALDSTAAWGELQSMLNCSGCDIPVSPCRISTSSVLIAGTMVAANFLALYDNIRSLSKQLRL